jgi:hypothetical protein
VRAIAPVAEPAIDDQIDQYKVRLAEHGRMARALEQEIIRLEQARFGPVLAPDRTFA